MSSVRRSSQARRPSTFVSFGTLEQSCVPEVDFSIPESEEGLMSPVFPQSLQTGNAAEAPLRASTEPLPPLSSRPVRARRPTITLSRSRTSNPSIPHSQSALGGSRSQGSTDFVNGMPDCVEITERELEALSNAYSVSQSHVKDVAITSRGDRRLMRAILESEVDLYPATGNTTVLQYGTKDTVDRLMSFLQLPTAWREEVVCALNATKGDAQMAASRLLSKAELVGEQMVGRPTLAAARQHQTLSEAEWRTVQDYIHLMGQPATDSITAQLKAEFPVRTSQDVWTALRLTDGNIGQARAYLAGSTISSDSAIGRIERAIENVVATGGARPREQRKSSGDEGYHKLNGAVGVRSSVTSLQPTTSPRASYNNPLTKRLPSERLVQPDDDGVISNPSPCHESRERGSRFFPSACRVPRAGSQWDGMQEQRASSGGRPSISKEHLTLSPTRLFPKGTPVYCTDDTVTHAQVTPQLTDSTIFVETPINSVASRSPQRTPTQREPTPGRTNPTVPAGRPMGTSVSPRRPAAVLGSGPSDAHARSPQLSLGSHQSGADSTAVVPPCGDTTEEPERTLSPRTAGLYRKSFEHVVPTSRLRISEPPPMRASPRLSERYDRPSSVPSFPPDDTPSLSPSIPQNSPAFPSRSPPAPTSPGRGDPSRLRKQEATVPRKPDGKYFSTPLSLRPKGVDQPSVATTSEANPSSKRPSPSTDKGRATPPVAASPPVGKLPPPPPPPGYKGLAGPPPVASPLAGKLPPPPPPPGSSAAPLAPPPPPMMKGANGAPPAPPPPPMMKGVNGAPPAPPPPPMMKGANGAPPAPPPPPMMKGANGAPPAPPPPPMMKGVNGAPPAPPPPPMMKGVNGAPPAPPPPGGKKAPGAPAHAPSLSTAAASIPGPTKTLPISAVHDAGKSVFTEASAVELPKDIQDNLIELFPRSVAAPVDTAKDAAKTKMIQILDSSRERNVGIILQFLRLPIQTIEASIRTFDELTLGEEHVGGLCTIIPSPEEIEQINRATKARGGSWTMSELHQLSLPVRFFMMTMHIDHYAQRIRAWGLKSELQTRLEDIEEKLQRAMDGVRATLEAPHLPRMLQIILAVSNFLNAGSRYQDAKGFPISQLPKIMDFRATGGKGVLLDYLVSIVEKEDPAVHRVTEELLPAVERAREIDVPGLEQELKKFRSRLGECATLVRAIPQDKRWCSVLGKFIYKALQTLERVEALGTALNAKIGQMPAFFCEPTSTFSMNDTLRVLTNFSKRYDVERSNQEEKRVRLARQAAAKEGASEAISACSVSVNEESHADENTSRSVTACGAKATPGTHVSTVGTSPSQTTTNSPSMQRSTLANGTMPSANGGNGGVSGGRSVSPAEQAPETNGPTTSPRRHAKVSRSPTSGTKD